MTIVKFAVLLILGAAVGAGIGFLAAKILLKRVVGVDKPSRSIQLAQTISERLTLLDKESAAAFTNNSCARIRAWIQEWYRQNSMNTMTLHEAFERFASAESIDRMADTISERLTAIIVRELAQRDSGSALSRIMTAQVRQRIALLGVLNNALTAAEAPIANVINHTIKTHAPGLLDREIRNIENHILDMRVCDLTEKSSVSVDRALDMLTQLCVTFCNEHMEEMLQSADVRKVIAHSVEAVANGKMDKLWNELVVKEQKLLVMLSAIVGFAASGMVLIGSLL